MRFLSVRDLKSKSAQIWKELPRLKDMVITSNGRPIAVLASITEDNLEEVLSAFRQARAVQAVTSIQYESAHKSLDKITAAEIDDEIKAVRANRKK